MLRRFLNIRFAEQKILIFLVLLVFTSFATCPVLDSTNDLSTINMDNQNPGGDLVSSIISGFVTVPNNSKMIDDFEDTTNGITTWGGPWYTYDDKGDNGNSTIDSFTVLSVASGNGVSGSKGLKINYHLGDSIGTGNDKYGPFVAVGVDVKNIPESNPLPEQEYRNLSKVTKFTYWYKGPKHSFHVVTKDLDGKDTYRVLIKNAVSSFTKVTFTFNDSVFTQAGWDTSPKPLDKTKVVGFNWMVSNTANEQGAIYLDDFQVVADFPDPGIAVVSLNKNTVDGQWQYNLTGNGTWKNFESTVAQDKATLLYGTAKIRFKPEGTNSGTPEIVIRAWDRSEDRANGVIGVDATVANSTDQTVFSEIPETTSVIVGGPPEIILQPTDITVIVGDTAKFIIDASGFSPITYKWQIKNGNNWDDIAGETKKEYSFKVVLGDDGNIYHCVASNTFGSTTSGSATLTVIPADSAPTIIAPIFKNDTLLEGDDYVFGKAQATGKPAPTFKWYYKKEMTSSSVKKKEADNFTIEKSTQDDEGYYFLVATNSIGSDTSDYAFISVFADPTITQDLNSTLALLENSEVSLKIKAKGDGKLNYQWYKNGKAMDGNNTDSLYVGKVTKEDFHDTTFNCTVWSTTLSNDTIGKVISSVVCTMSIGEYSNPFELSVERLNEQSTSEVKITISSSQDLTNFPTVLQLGKPYAENVWVLYQTKKHPTDKDDVVEIVKYKIDDIKNSSGNKIVKTLNVKPFPTDNDEHYYFSNTILWKDGSNNTLFPLLKSDKVFLGDSLSPENNLEVSGKYEDGTDYAKLAVTETGTLDELKDSLVVFESSNDEDFGQLIHTVSKSVNDLKKDGDSTNVSIKVGINPFSEKTIWIRWRIIAKNEAKSEYISTSFIAGVKRPEYTGRLKADTTSVSSRVLLTWDATDSDVEKIRIWFNTEEIPMEYDISLPPDKEINISDITKTKHTVKNLSSNTTYYFGLQIYKDNQWSYVTKKSSASVRTIKADSTLIVENKIDILSSWFNPVSNALCLEWDVDESLAPESTVLEWAYSFSLDPDDAFKDGISGSWSRVSLHPDTLAIELNKDIVFDASYSVGMWLRAFKVSDTTFGPESGPGDSIYTSIKTPSFTWEVIKITDDKVDTGYIANGKIIMISTVKFSFKDTVTAYHYPDDLPKGFVDIGGVSCFFDKNPMQVAPFKFGLIYESLPENINKNDIAMYQIHNDGTFHVCHNFTVENKAVWTKVAFEDMKYPFMILADTLAPKIILNTDKYEEIIPLGKPVSTWFTVIDNVSNSIVRFEYGNGKTGYIFVDSGYTRSTRDTIKCDIPNENQVINGSFGTLARLIINDGVNENEKNVSRRVMSNGGDGISFVSEKWTPLKVSIELDNKDLKKIFNESFGDGKQWEYDTYKYRLYRWFNENENKKNEWMEYSDENNKHFSLEPCKLMWFKILKDDKSIVFGKGITNSLVKPYEIKLKPKSWTDISFPFQFDILLKDILEESESVNKDLEIYHWKKSSYKYIAQKIFLSSVNAIHKVRDTILYDPKNDGYTVYNHSSSEKTLFVPPLSLAMSKNHARIERKKEKNTAAWDIQFLWKDKEILDNSSFSILCCAYNKEFKKTTYGPMPPSMTNLNAGFVNEYNGQVSGWALHNSLDEGGLIYDLRLTNESKEKKTIEYFLANTSVLPKSYKAGVFDPEDKTYHFYTDKSVTTLSIEPEKDKSMYVVVGTDEFFSKAFQWLIPGISLVKAFPNPFSSILKINYRLPLNIREVNFDLYDIKGRKIWHTIEQKKFKPGNHIYHFDSRYSNKRNGGISAGVYILRLTAKDQNGVVKFGGEKRLTCIR